MVVLVIKVGTACGFQCGTPVDVVPDGTALSDNMLRTFACLRVPDAFATAAMEYWQDADGEYRHRRYKTPLSTLAARMGSPPLEARWRDPADAVPIADGTMLTVADLVEVPCP